MGGNDGFPILKMRADGPAGVHSELSLNDQVLESWVSLKLEVSGDKITTATIVLEVVPDVELPAEVYRADPPPAPDVVEVYRDTAGSWRWHRKAPNHAVISGSQESFSNLTHAVRAARRANTGTELTISE